MENFVSAVELCWMVLQFWGQIIVISSRASSKRLGPAAERAGGSEGRRGPVTLGAAGTRTGSLTSWGFLCCAGIVSCAINSVWLHGPAGAQTRRCRFGYCRSRWCKGWLGRTVQRPPQSHFSHIASYFTWEGVKGDVFLLSWNPNISGRREKAEGRIVWESLVTLCSLQVWRQMFLLQVDF